jgi:exoribonuclease II
VEIVPSWVRVTRLTYAVVNDRLAEEPFRRMVELTDTYQARRRANDAVFIELPEVKIHVQAGAVQMLPLLPLESRTLVTEAMLMAGEAAARYALERQIPLPFTRQDPPEGRDQPEELPPGLPAMFALRRTLKRSQQSSVPGPHAGLGLGVYTRATSPLRRYLDLVVHQQLRAYLRGTGLLGEQAVLERVGAAEAVTGSVRQAERLANRHWTLVYFLQHPHWRGDGIVVEKRLRRMTILIPACGFEVQVPLAADVPLGTTVQLTLQGVSLPDLDVHFQVSE